MSAVRQPRIALLVDHLESDYPAQIVTGVLRAARLARARTWIVPGGWLSRSPEEPVVRNFIYERVAAADVDGFVLSAGSLSNFCGLQRFRDWLAAFTKVPCVALGLDAAERQQMESFDRTAERGVVPRGVDRRQRTE